MRYAGVFRKLRMLGDLAEVLLVGTDRRMIFSSSVPDGIFTVYHALVSETNPVILCLDPESTAIPYEPSETFSCTIQEICAGLGGIGLGCALTGGIVLAPLDHSTTACKHLELNEHGQVLCRDLCNDHAKGELHLLGGKASTLAAGFPCQPHSAQGPTASSLDTCSAHCLFACCPMPSPRMHSTGTT